MLQHCRHCVLTMATNPKLQDQNPRIYWQLSSFCSSVAPAVACLSSAACDIARKSSTRQISVCFRLFAPCCHEEYEEYVCTEPAPLVCSRLIYYRLAQFIAILPQIMSKTALGISILPHACPSCRNMHWSKMDRPEQDRNVIYTKYKTYWTDNVTSSDLLGHSACSNQCMNRLCHEQQA